jgi:hypothetical protein
MIRTRTECIGRRRWLVPLLAFACTLLAPALFGNPLPTCGVASLATYDAAGYQCTLGDFTLEDFTFSSTQTGGATLLSDSQITVDPTSSSSTGISLQFNGNFTALADQTEQYVFQYELDPVLPRISGPSIDLGPNDPVSLTGEFCGNGTIVSSPNTNPSTQPTCSGNDPAGIFPAKLQISGAPAGASLNYAFPQLVTNLDSRLILDLDGPASVQTFGTTANLTPTPEPSTVLWLTPALFAALWLRKSRLSARAAR